MEIVAATGNQHKVIEMQKVLEPYGIQVLSADDVGGLPEVEENASTFEGNAILKAQAAAAHCNRLVFADDSGLEVFALNGEPGIYSSRYAGEESGYDIKMNKILTRLQEQQTKDRRARFVCVIAVARPGEILGTFEGEITGQIMAKPAGCGGFGYDPIFQPDGYEKSFAEIPEEEKNKISHRGNALRALMESKLLLNFE